MIHPNEKLAELAHVLVIAGATCLIVYYAYRVLGWLADWWENG